MVKGVLPAEYGGVVGGELNMLTRSGTNDFHGSLFENWQDEGLLPDPCCRLRSPSRTFASINAAGRWAVPSY